MKQVSDLLQSLGAGDGNGNVSSGRIVMYLMVAAVLLPHVVLAIKTGTAIALTQTDLELLAGTGLFKIWHGSQENEPTPKP